MTKILCVLGTRPEATKMGPLIDELRRHPGFHTEVCVTAQHREMLDQVLELFGIVPDYDLDIMKHGQSLESILAECLRGLASVLREAKPHLVLVHGDTSTTFAASLAAYYAGTRLGHVEAGLRTHDKYQPFPEEMNRKLTAALADYHFAPTRQARDNLLREGIGDAFITGNTAVDCLRYTVTAGHRFRDTALGRVEFAGRRVLAMTAHRRENLGEPLDAILYAVRDIAREYADAVVVYPVHRNPAVVKQVEAVLGGEANVVLTDPVDMNDMHNLIARSYLVLTDSGGIQEEAPGLNIPVVVLRNVTERPEGLEAGTLVLAGTERAGVYSQIKRLMDDKALYAKMAAARNPFGDGWAARRIVAALAHIFQGAQRPEDYV